jgi:two-component system, LytTR family, sensor kinase
MKVRTRQKTILKTLFTYTWISVLVGAVSMFLQTDPQQIEFVDHLINAIYSILIGFSLFANSWLFNWVEVKYVSWIERPFKSLIIIGSIHIIYSTLAIYSVNYLWFTIAFNIEWHQFLEEAGRTIILGEYIALFLITTIFYARSFFFDWRSKAIETEKLKSEAIALQYQVMQNQVNPHFLFNSLNVLSSLIDIDSSQAKQFTRELSLFYRDLLSLKDKDLISIQQELEFVKRYVYLQTIRFGGHFQVQFYIDDNLKGDVIPMSIQMLVENAVKHNEISQSNPLEVLVGTTTDREIFVENNLQPKSQVDHSHNIGLKNLTERYKYLTGRKIEVENNGTFFRVKLPLVDTDFQNSTPIE